MSNNKTKRMIGIAMLASVAFVLSQFSFPLLPGVPFLKVDFSDIPVLIGMSLYGPGGGIFIAFLRSLLHYVQTGGEAGIPIGDSAAFIASVALTLPIYYSLKRNSQSLLHKAIGGAAGTFLLTLAMVLLNWLVLAPAYMAVMNFSVGPIREYITLAVVPFNLLKGPIVSVAFFAVYAKLQPWLERNSKKLGLEKEKKLAVKK